jgi:hypothetical protein
VPVIAKAIVSIPVVLIALFASVIPGLAQESVQEGAHDGSQPGTLDRLVRAYPAALASHDGTTLTWKDGTRMPVGDGRSDKTFAEKLKSPTILDQLSIPYPKGRLAAPPSLEHDPGRFRNVAFFNKMYGNCSNRDVERKLVKVPWLPKAGGGFVQITSVNDVAVRLRAVSDALDQLPASLRAYAFPSAGTYNCRVVKDTGNPSAHGWGIAIDLNTRYADYWLWAKTRTYVNRIPFEIVELFERHGFIWGGKWGHFDTMHFEYRPELL